MQEEFRQRLSALAKRAGVSGIPPAVVVAAAVCLLCLIAFAAWQWWPREQGSIASNGVASAAAGDVAHDAAQPETSTASVVVYVTGAVKNPGVYELPAGSRIVSAVEAAGGLVAGAAHAGVNLAEELRDGEQIVVPTQEEFEQSGGAASGNTGSASTGSGSTGSAGKLVNINTADAALLDTLPGVGPATAAKIIADRQANGPFKSVDDLARVSGIGDTRLAELKDLICVR